MRLRYFIIPLLSILALVGCSESVDEKSQGLNGSTISNTGAISWYSDLFEAREDAKNANLPMYVFFTGQTNEGTWCSWCHLFEKNYLNNERFKSDVAHNFVFVKIELPPTYRKDREADDKEGNFETRLLNSYKIRGVPTIAIIDPISMDLIYKHDSLHSKEKGPKVEIEDYISELMAIKLSGDTSSS